MKFTQDNKSSFDRKVTLDRRQSLDRVYVNIPLGGGEGGEGGLTFPTGVLMSSNFLITPNNQYDFLILTVHPKFSD